MVKYTAGGVGACPFPTQLQKDPPPEPTVVEKELACYLDCYDITFKRTQPFTCLKIML